MLEKQKNEFNRNKRLEYFDIAKGIAILCIILGHMGIRQIDEIVFSFHVPIFFIISGYFIKPMKIKKLVKSNFKRLVLPYIFTCLIVLFNFLIISVIKNDFIYLIQMEREIFLSSLYGSGSLTSTFLKIKPIGAIWFLLALFWGKLFFNLIINRKEKIIYIIIMFLLGYISSKFIWLPLSLQSGLLSTIFIYLGYIIRKYDITSKFNITNVLLLLTIWIFTIIINHIFYGYDVMSIVKAKFTCIPLNIISSISGSLFVIGLSKYLEKQK